MPGDSIDRDGLNTFLAIGSAKAQSLIKGIEVVPPGTVLRVYPNGNVQTLYRYQFNTERTFHGTFADNVKEYDRLMAQAIKRLIFTDTTGLYLSGGIDSALVAIYLKKAGVKVHAYTSLPWGVTGTEAKFAQINAKVSRVDAHYSVPLDTKDYAALTSKSLQVYGNPRGISSQIGLISLWQESPIGQEEQVFCGHNADTIVCAMPSQYQTYFSSWLPRVVRRKVHPWIGVGNYREDYLSVVSRTRFRSVPILDEAFLGRVSRVQGLTVLGMLVGHTGEGEAFSLPVVKNNKIFSDPYFDMDLIEFCLNQSFINRVGISRNAKTILYFEKKISRALALQYLPRDLVFRKKGMTVPIDRDQASKDFFASLPKEIGGFKLKYPEERMAAQVLNDFVSAYKLKF
jgi:asparagine synthetase B (glutamine-hydrolysing)